MFEWEKLGRVFDPAEISDVDWMKEYAQAPSVLEYEEFLRVYFSTRPAPDKDGRYLSYSSYVDLEKNNLLKIKKFASKPVLRLGKKGTFDEFGTYPISVIRFDGEIRAYYAGWTRCESVPFNVAIGVAFSSNNGKTFERISDGPILSYSYDEPFILSGPKIRRFNNKWYLWYIAGKKWISGAQRVEPVYKIRMAISEDGLKWEKVSKDLIPSKIEVDEAQASPDVFFKNGLFHMFFCYRYSLDYRLNDRGYRIGYAYSNDLLNWTRDDSRVGIDLSPEGWDSQSIAYPHVFELNNDIYMMYLGNDVGRNGFGIARLINYKNSGEK